MLKNVNKIKRSDVYINEDFNREETKLREKLWEEVKQLRSEGKFGSLFYEDKDLKTLFTLVNQEPQKINEWFEAKKLSVNIRKIRYSLFSKPSRLIT